MAARPLTAAPSLTANRNEERRIARAADDLQAEIQNAARTGGGLGGGLTAGDAEAIADNAIAEHVAETDPHAQYATDTAVADAIAAHVALPDPHTQYITSAEAAAAEENLLHKTGNETKTGNLTVVGEIIADRPVGTNRTLRFATSGVSRWALFANTTAESGANEGSDLRIYSYNDAGAFLAQAAACDRSTGVWDFSGATMSFGGKLVAADTDVVHIAGTETITGVKTFGDGSIASQMNIDAAAGQYGNLMWKSAGAQRWSARKSNDAGNSFVFLKYNDAAVGSTVYSIDRATGVTTFAEDIIGNKNIGTNGAFAGDAALLFTAPAGGMWTQRDGATRYVALGAGAGSVQPQFIGARCGGTLASPAATPSGAIVLQLYASGYTGAAWTYPASISFTTTELHSATNRGISMDIWTTLTGAVSPSSAWKIDGSQNWLPGSDNLRTLGNATYRPYSVWAGTGGVISTGPVSVGGNNVWHAGNMPLDYGTYTPTLTLSSNCASATSGVCMWTRVGNVVQVSGQLAASATTAADTSTAFKVSLPIPSALTANPQGSGAATAANFAAKVAVPIVVNMDASTDTANFMWFSPTTASMSINFTFAYQVLP